MRIMLWLGSMQFRTLLIDFRFDLGPNGRGILSERLGNLISSFVIINHICCTRREPG